ncbi:MAG TPA: sulfotransferase [Solirubrobacterales bacterium]|nr:sulfotransferase [Solirubrobacterales bacterium]
MAILIQGMRRSGTTILYDAMLEDPELRCFYEPLREDTETPGGGSGARETDPFAETRALRKEFAAEHYPDLPLEEFNWGGPREPALEIGPELPEHCTGFIGHLLDRPEPVMIKFTRIYDKLRAVAPLAPGAVFVHVVRDPRAVAASMMMGKGRKNADRYENPTSFFAERRKRKLWSSGGLSAELLTHPEYSHIRRPANFLRILLVWKHCFENTYRDGRRLFGDRYVLLRNEELRADPVGAISRVYRAAERPTPPEVAAWARGAVKPPEVPYAANDPRWTEAFARVGMADALEAAGYPVLADAAHEARAPSRLTGLMSRARARMAKSRD